MNQFHTDSCAHNIPSVFRIHGILNLSALEKSFKKIINRHEIFRTVFSSDENGELIQIISYDSSFIIPVIDLRDSVHNKDHISELIEYEIVQPFDLKTGPLIRSKIFELGSDHYILVIVMHHIITDLRTKDLFSEELSLLYNAFAEDQPAPLAEPAFQYSDYALWHKQFQQDKKFTEQADFWKELLQNTNKVLSLPVENKRPPIQSLDGSIHPFNLSEAFTKQLKQFSRQNCSDIFLTLLTAFVVVLGRYSNQSDFIVGIPLTNRRKESHKQTLGCFVNILPVPVDLTENPDFKTMMRRLRTIMLGAHRNQEITLESIVNIVQPSRDASYNPLFQVGYTFEHPMSLSFNDLEIIPLPTHNKGSQLDMFAVFWESGKEIKGYFEYCPQLFSSLFMQGFSQAYHIFLSGLLNTQEKPVELLPLLSEKEKNKILFDWNNTQKKYQEIHILHRVFEKQVEKTPGLTALKFDSRQLTYSELNRQANKLAHFIRKSGVESGTCVGIFMDRSIEMVISIYGILKAGCAYVPLDPEYPADRIQFMLEDTQVSALFTQNHLKGKLPEYGGRIICLDSEWSCIENCSESNPDIEIRPDNPAYVIFTSGSTGRPKGAINSHRGICNRLFWMQDEYGLTESDSVLQKTPFSFDVSVWEFFWPLLAGARLVIAPPETHKDPSELIRLITENKITTIHFVPPMLHIFLQNQHVEKCLCLKRVICSGEALQYDDQKKFFSCLNAELHNLYGPTEAAVDVTYWACTKESEHETVPIGRPVSNTQIYILDRFLNPVPVGVQGELHIGGVQVSAGYLNRPELTRQKFIADPFSKDSNAKLYKTGDLARFWPDGTIEYIGRMDHQVKVRGFRIELGEIESVLCDHPGVGQAVIIVKNYDANDQRLVGYLVPDKKNGCTINDIKQYLKNKLPDYMVPSLFVLLDEMPLTSNGKINRQLLPEPEIKRIDLARQYVSPQTDLEEMIENIWIKILRIDKVGIHDNFFEIGGTSLLCAVFISQLQIQFKKNIPIVKVFQYPTISSFANFLKTEGNAHPLSINVQKRAELRKKALSKKRDC